MHVEFLQFFVQRKTGRVSCNFEQHAAGFAEINGMKISAVDYWRDVIAKVDEMFAPLELFGLVLRAKGNVMYRTGGDAAHRGVGLTQHVNNSPWRRVIRRRKSESISRFINQTIAEALGEQSGSSLVTFQRGGDTVEAVKRMLGRNGAVRPRLDVCRRHACRYSDQLNQKSVRIYQPNHFFSETRRCSLSRDVVLLQTLKPKTNRIRWNRERC